jgi:N6-L-threonylcarbamoyladenine synthase
VARLLGLPYPGGPEISKIALQGKQDFNFPRPMLNSGDYNFSFSGLKTAVKNFIAAKQLKTINYKLKTDVALSFEVAVVDVLITKALRAAKQYHCKTLALGGGVAANQRLRAALKQAGKDNGLAVVIPEFKLCTDNAEMIALAAYYHLRNGGTPTPLARVQANPNWEL